MLSAEALATNRNWRLNEPRVRNFKKQSSNTRRISIPTHLVYVRNLLVFTLLVALSLSRSEVFIQPASAATSSINIQNFAFNPQNVTIQSGTSVTWTNNDPVIYTLWFTNASGGSTYLLSPPVNPGTSWTHTFPDNLRLLYYDFDRLSIAGQLIVVPILTGDFGPTLQLGTTIVPFVAAVSGGTPPYTFFWTFGDGTNSINPAPTHTYQSFGSYNVTLTVTDSSTPNAFTLTVTHLVTVSQTGGSGRRPLAM